MGHVFFPMLNDNPSAVRSAQLCELVCNDVRAEEAVLEQLHPDGRSAISEALIAGAEFIAQVSAAEIELGEAAGAQAAATDLHQRVFDADSYIFNQVRSIAPNLSPAEDKTLRAAYSLGSRRLSVRRVADLRVLTEQIHNAHKVHGATLRAWGVPQHRLDAAGALLAEFPDVGATLQKETAEAEAAIIKRDAAEQRFYTLLNPLLRRLLAAQDDYPDAAQRFASTINKYAAELNPPSPDAAPAPAEPA